MFNTVRYRVIGDGICSLCSLVMLVVVLTSSTLKPFERGFDCEDISIKHPEKPPSLTPIWLIGWFLVLPTFFIAIYEMIEYFAYNHTLDKNALYRVYNEVVVFVFGICSSFLIAEIIQLRCGRLRPYFLDVCKPNVDCDLPENRYRYITNYVCTNAVESDVVMARKSFPSIHALISTQATSYISLYLQMKDIMKTIVLMKRFIQSLLFGVSVYVSVRRISDNANHWGDVLVGMFIGILFAFYMFYFMNSYRTNETPKEE
ncbi:uncharacterized protein T28D9.3-like [Cimex lectularius]|uniref:Phosphatidic acid phosphatase type 2/haloperoxidase domain-containing protein n=1 Tax=Cimex lectularius TaxID=79782 RepID=A0A8I6TDX1_CIMLE|nr:uncharacterized protein T28D9.3-like [Cimex lectularius]